MFRRKLLVGGALFLLLVAAILGGCAQPEAPAPAVNGENGSPEEAPPSFKVGVVQIMEHAALDDARLGALQALADEGFVEGENITFDYKNAQGETATAVTISQGFVADDVDLIFAIATPAAQAAATATEDIPIVFNSVTEPLEAGLVESWEQPGTNVTGVSDLNPVRETLELILEILPGAENIGVIYNTGEVNSVVQVDISKKIAPELGLNLVESIVTHTGEVGTAAEALIGQVDAIFVPTDNTTLTAFQSVLHVTEDNNLPVIGCATEFAELGAIAAIGFNYYDLGYQSGIMAAEVLRGANPADMPIQLPTEVFYAVNEEAAQKIGLELPRGLLDRAEIKY